MASPVMLHQVLAEFGFLTPWGDMNHPIPMQMLTLATGCRLLRPEEEARGLSLERKPEPGKPVVAQKARLLRRCEIMLQNGMAAA
jgi:hypothetical protein